MILRWAYPQVFLVFIPLLVLVVLYRIFIRRTPLYRYPLASYLKTQKLTVRAYHTKIFFVLRVLSLLGLIALIARPQWVDQRSRINIEGVDIVIALDISESMTLFDDLSDRRTRIDIAKQEALRFIDKRVDDPIGLVLFAHDAIARCPLTLDKPMIKDIIQDVKIGFIDPSGTWLGTGLATAINRLRNSKAKSKIIILLTDGQPTPPEKITPEAAMTMAKHFGIKIYTVGIGNEQGGYGINPYVGGVVQVDNSLNVNLLREIASQTGGAFFRAQNASDMRQIYNTIDTLEKTEYQTDLFSRYYEAFLVYLWALLCLIGIELILRLFVFRGIA